MKISEIKDLLKADVLVGDDQLDHSVVAAGGAHVVVLLVERAAAQHANASACARNAAAEPLELPN